MPGPFIPAERAVRDHPSRFVIPVAVMLITFGCFAASIGFGFLKGDDEPLLVEATGYRGLGAEHIRWMFETFLTGPYQPLSWLSYAIDWSLWGLNPTGFHLTNVLLHSATALAVYFLALRLIGVARRAGGVTTTADRLSAGFAALLFAIHPLRAESVAWVTERRDVVSGLFFVLTLIAWMRYAAAPRLGWYLLAFGLFVFSLLGKATGMTLPLSLLVLDVYPLRRLGRGREPTVPGAGRIILEKLPFFGVSIAIAAVAIHGQRMEAMFVSSMPIGHRMAIAAYASFFYIWKTLLPFGLSPLYERPEPLVPTHYLFVFSGVAITGLTVIALGLRRRCPGLLVAWLFYLITLAPVSGLAQAGFQIAADRYSYLPMLGFAILAGGLARGALGERGVAPKLLLGGVVAILAAMTFRQVSFWADDYAVWKRAVSVSTPFARSPHALANFSALSAARGDLEAAVSAAEQATRVRPGDPLYWRNYAVFLRQSGRGAESLEAYRRGAECRPANADALADYGWGLASMGRWGESAPLFQQAVEVQPTHQRALLGVGFNAVQQKRFDEAAVTLERAMSIAPLPDDQVIGVASAWFSAGQPGRAVEALRGEVKRRSDDEYLAVMLAWPLATHPEASVRNGAEALRLVQPIAARPGGMQGQAMRALVAAQAETGDFAGARATLAELIRGETRGGQAPVAGDLAGMEADLQAGRAIRRQPG